MTREVITCSPDDALWRARKLMRKHGFRHIPIVEGDKVCGMLSVRDILEDRVEEQELEINVLRDAVVAARHR